MHCRTGLRQNVIALAAALIAVATASATELAAADNSYRVAASRDDIATLMARLGWDDRGGSRRSKSYSNLRRVVPPSLTDTNGRQCRGFGRLFSIVGGKHQISSTALKLPPQRLSSRALSRLAQTMVELQPDARGGNSEMPAGYTFLAQFIDHDITLDTTSMLNVALPDSAFKNARSVALDLDSVYGGGPEVSPHLYRLPYVRVGRRISGCGHFSRFDLLRTEARALPGPEGGAARALIGDPRNDENFVIAQMHALFIAYHNRLVDLLVERKYPRRCPNGSRCDVRQLAEDLASKAKKEIFEQARNHVIHYYHRIVIEDFLPRLIGDFRVRDMLSNGRDFFLPNSHGGGSTDQRATFIPVEFAVAAFRYGHSQVREQYVLRRDRRVSLLSAPDRRNPGSVAFQPINSPNIVDWRYFFPLDERLPRGFNFARRIDRSITPALHDLGRSRVVSRDDVLSLPDRNLRRGQTFSLPSGQAVAQAVLPVLAARGLLSPGSRSRRSQYDEPWRSFLLDQDRATRRSLKTGETPLWYYILQEAEALGGASRFGVPSNALVSYNRQGRTRIASLLQATSADRAPRLGQQGHTLGPVGGTIVGEVLIGLLDDYRASTGNGLGFRPTIRARYGGDARAQFSGTPVRHPDGRYEDRYLMANLIIDAGQASLRSGEYQGSKTCNQFLATSEPNERYIGTTGVQPEPNTAAVYDQERFQPTLPTVQRRTRQAGATAPRSSWRKNVFRNR